MDRRSIYLMIACVALFFGWNKYISLKYPNYGSRQGSAVQTQPVAQTTQSGTETHPQAGGKESGKETESLAAGINRDLKTSIIEKPERELRFESETVNFTVSSRGMGIKNIELNKFTDKEKQKIRLGLSDKMNLFELRWGGQSLPVDFEIKSAGDGLFIGEAALGETTILREMRFNKDNYSFSNQVTVKKPSTDILQGLRFFLPEKITVTPSTSFLFPSYEHQDFYVNHDGKSETINFSAAKEDLNKDFKSASLVALSSQYFATVFLDKSEIAPEINLKSQVIQKTAAAEIVYRPVTLQDTFSFKQVLYLGPKSIDVLKSADAELPQVIDFGMLGVIARPLLYFMKFCFELVGNWGIAIILLTLMVRLVVLPFNIMSMRSMKAMQKIQPLMTSVRERYKDDPVRMNQEIMALMKENKANPLGGCLPMLLQIPIFFALYRVIGSSIELYQSPFLGWITDLSHHDKFYVLPVLMGVTMYVQQKLTPTNMDPAQAKILAFLPLIFTVFMLQLPSGLTLYMFVSALFGITQQWYMLRKTA